FAGLPSPDTIGTLKHAICIWSEPMQFGICSTPDEASALAEAGFDFVEWPVNQTVGDMDEQAYQALLKHARDLPIAPEAWNVLLPRSIKVVGPEVDHSRLRQYVET